MCARPNMDPFIFGGIMGILLPILFFVGIIVCCVTCICWCHKRGRRRRHQTVNTISTVANSPMQPLGPPGYQLFYPGYQPVPVGPGYGGQPNPTTPPPSYMEATNPALYPGTFSPGQPMFPFHSQAYAPPPASHEHAQTPYNPTYYPNQ